MLRGRPRRIAPPWLFLAGLYLVATIVNAALAIRVAALWPAVFAGLLATATATCVVFALRRRG